MKRGLLFFIILSAMVVSCGRSSTNTTNNSPLAYPIPSEGSSKTVYKTPKQSQPAATKTPSKTKTH